ncbi:MAG: hypothetical protein ABSG51_03205 [Terracidiphilus sp.]|jgi:hypothetical protein
MRKLASFLALTAFVMLAMGSRAQTPNKPEPGFTLTLSLGRHGGEFSKNTQVLLVTLTNTSKEAINNSWCLAFRGMYDLAVTYNGIPVEETDAQKQFKKFRQAGRCSGSFASRVVNPGEQQEDNLYYDTTKPGTYEFTVSRETYPWNPEKSVTVKSNTLTFVVKPEDLEPEPDAPK